MNKKLLLVLIIVLSLILSACSRDIINKPYQDKKTDKKKEMSLMPLKSEKVESRKNIVVPIPRGGVYPSAFRLKFKGSSPDLKVYYTTNLKNYDTNSFTLYELPILIDRDMSVRYFAKIGGQMENVQQVEYKIVPNLTPEQVIDTNTEERNKDIEKFLYDLDVKKPQ